MITEELTWQQFKTLDSIRTLNENQQIEHYYKYLVELNDWISHQNKGRSLTAGLDLTAASIIFNTGDKRVFTYNTSTGTSTQLNIPNGSYIYTGDIAHTENKLWTSAGGVISEWNITLSPFTATFSRIITTPHNIGSGLGAINNTTLIATNADVTPNTVVTLDITNDTATSTNKFNLTANATNRTVTGDILLTTTNKVLVTNNAGSSKYITQFSYPTGTVEVDVEIGSTINAAYGLYIENNKIYIINSDGNVYQIEKTTPYGLTLVGSTGVAVNGASQLPSALTANFT
jgi:hypothetical protein